MDLVIKKDSNGEKDYRGYDLPKYYIISAVANTCGSFMAFMNKYFNTTINYVDFATNIHIELYLEEKEGGIISENDYRIEYFFNDDFLLSIPYVEFKNKIKNELYNKTAINEFCKKKDDKEEKKDDDDGTDWYLIGIFIGLGVIVVLVVIIVIVLRTRMKNNQENREFDNNDNNPLVRDTRISGE